MEIEQIVEQRWDVTVVGAGPAGVVAASECQRLGRKVLLLDKASFPRPKVCGGCVNQSMLATLERVGLRVAVAVSYTHLTLPTICSV